jgi:hypothetical protein
MNPTGVNSQIKTKIIAQLRSQNFLFLSIAGAAILVSEFLILVIMFPSANPKTGTGRHFQNSLPELPTFGVHRRR